MHPNRWGGETRKRGQQEGPDIRLRLVNAGYLGMVLTGSNQPYYPGAQKRVLG